MQELTFVYYIKQSWKKIQNSITISNQFKRKMSSLKGLPRIYLVEVKEQKVFPKVQSIVSIQVPYKKG